MATQNPVARAIASATSRLWFPAALLASRNLPRPLMHRGGRALAAVYYRLRPKYLRAARRNLAVILGESEDAPEVRRLASEMVASHFRAWVDFMHFATRPPGTPRASSRASSATRGSSRGGSPARACCS